MENYKCEECGKTFKSYQALGGHKSSHVRGEVYRSKRETEQSKNRREKSISKIKECEYCGKTFDNGLALGGHKTSCSMNPRSNEIRKKLSKALKGKTLSDDVKKKISKGMKMAHYEGRAWNIGKSRWNNNPSYPEEFFMKVIMNEFEDKNYIREFPIGIYSADFCWESKKRIIEIDGEQHHRFKEYKERDKRKDEYIKSLGFDILRIRWKDMMSMTKEKIKEAYKFIHS